MAVSSPTFGPSYLGIDLETTGTWDTDQVTQAGCVRANNALMPEKLQLPDSLPQYLGRGHGATLRARLTPGMIPDAMAMHVTGMYVDDLLKPGHSEYTLTRRMVDIQKSNIGYNLTYNGDRFDYKRLRQMLYRNLFPPFLTSQYGIRHIDLFQLVQAAIYLSPGLISLPFDACGFFSMKLGDICDANGITADGQLHDAEVDIFQTLRLAAHIRRNDREFWRQGVRFADRAEIHDLFDSEPVLIEVTDYRGKPRFSVWSPITRNPTDANEYGMYNPLYDPHTPKSFRTKGKMGNMPQTAMMDIPAEWLAHAIRGSNKKIRGGAGGIIKWVSSKEFMDRAKIPEQNRRHYVDYFKNIAAKYGTVQEHDPGPPERVESVWHIQETDKPTALSAYRVNRYRRWITPRELPVEVRKAIGLTDKALQIAEGNIRTVKQHPTFCQTFGEALELVWERDEEEKVPDAPAEIRLMEKFYSESDKDLLIQLHHTPVAERPELIARFGDHRLQELATNHCGQLGILGEAGQRAFEQGIANRALKSVLDVEMEKSAFRSIPLALQDLNDDYRKQAGEIEDEGEKRRLLEGLEIGEAGLKKLETMYLDLAEGRARIENFRIVRKKRKPKAMLLNIDGTPLRGNERKKMLKKRQKTKA